MGYFDTLLRYFELSGRSSRGQFWMFQLCYLVLGIAAVYGDFQMTGQLPDDGHWGLLLSFVVFFHIVPQVTVGVRRLHDIGKSGWWYLLWFVPIGGLFTLVWSFYGSEAGSNEYGDDPHDRQQDARPASRSAKRSPTGDAAQAMLARMEARRGGSRLAP